MFAGEATTRLWFCTSLPNTACGVCGASLKTWSLESGDLIEDIEWHQSALKGEGTALYAAQFSKEAGHSLIAAGGSNANVAKVPACCVAGAPCRSSVRSHG